MVIEHSEVPEQVTEVTNWPAAPVHLPREPQLGERAVSKQGVKVQVSGLDVPVLGHHVHGQGAVQYGGSKQQVHCALWVVEGSTFYRAHLPGCELVPATGLHKPDA